MDNMSESRPCVLLDLIVIKKTPKFTPSSLHPPPPPLKPLDMPQPFIFSRYL